MVTEFTRCPTSAWCASHLTHPARNISFFQRIIFRVDMRKVWMVLAKPLFSRRLTTTSRAAERWQRQCSERRYVKAHAIPLRTCHASKLCPVSPKYFSHPSSPTTHLVKWRILGQKKCSKAVCALEHSFLLYFLYQQRVCQHFEVFDGLCLDS